MFNTRLHADWDGIDSLEPDVVRQCIVELIQSGAESYNANVHVEFVEPDLALKEATNLIQHLAQQNKILTLLLDDRPDIQNLNTLGYVNWSRKVAEVLGE